MAEALSEKTIDVVKTTVPALEKGGTAVTDRMYQILFRNPEIRDLFNQSHHGESGSQSKALTAAVIAYAATSTILACWRRGWSASPRSMSASTSCRSTITS
jgi:hemoglobin-like flavoprotein